MRVGAEGDVATQSLAISSLQPPVEGHQGRALSLSKFGNRPNTVSESRVSKSELNEICQGGTSAEGSWKKYFSAPAEGQQQQLKTTSDVTSKFPWCCRASVLSNGKEALDVASDDPSDEALSRRRRAFDVP